MKTLSETAQVANIIRKELKARKITATVTSARNTVRIRVNDMHPAEIEALKNNYTVYIRGYFDGMSDSYHSSNYRDDIPQIDYLDISNCISDDMRQKAHEWALWYYFGTIPDDAPSRFEDAGAYRVHDMLLCVATDKILSGYYPHNYDFWDYNGDHNHFCDVMKARHETAVIVLEQIDEYIALHHHLSIPSLDWWLDERKNQWLIASDYHETSIVQHSHNIVQDLIESIHRHYAAYLNYNKEKAEYAAMMSETLEPVAILRCARDINVKFPSANKNNTLEENDYEMSLDSYVESCRVVKSITLTDRHFQILSKTLLENRTELFEEIGGYVVDDESLFENVAAHSKEYSDIFYQHGYKPVIEIINVMTGDAFYVDTSGYSYARYVGRRAESIKAFN